MMLACNTEPVSNKTNYNFEKVVDVHSFANFEKIRSKHLDLELKIDFEKKILQGSATWHIDQIAQDSIFTVDIDELRIDSVFLDDTIKTSYYVGGIEAYKGQPLHIRIQPQTKKVSIFYATNYSETDTFTAIQWLDPSQTKDKIAPFLYTQSEPNLARTWIPSQDAPMVKVTYNAQITVPQGLMAVMSATNQQHEQISGVYSFNMKQAIPTYLIALAVGKLSFKAIDAQNGVYAEPSMVEAAAAEFDELPAMIQAATAICGPYDWERYDVLVLPPGFPIGGMENPRLTFATPTILAGDKSLVSLIAHELAHSWSGNLVTNATWNDLWLNEGFTVYFERRIIEAIRGKDYAAMLWDLGRTDLEASLRFFSNQVDLTKLKLNLQHQNPELSLTDIPYEKGSLMLLKIEQVVGRENFDAFIKQYLQAFRFQSLTTETFVDYINTALLSKNPEWLNLIQLEKWLYEPGLPEDVPSIPNPKFKAVIEALNAYKNRKSITDIPVQEWSTHEWIHFIRNFDSNITYKDMENLDAQFQLSSSTNSEIACIWYVKAIERNYEKAYTNMKAFLRVTGRQKFLEPIYTALRDNPKTQKLATSIYNTSQQNYHPIARKNIHSLLVMN